MSDPSESVRRILIVDHTQQIHDDFDEVLARSTAGARYRLDHARASEAALDMIRTARNEGDPYLVIFIDLRMPSAWDGHETMSRMWQVDPDVHVVLCTGYSDFSWEDLVQRVPHVDQFMVLKKPFDAIEVRQMALALSERRLRSSRTTAKRSQILRQIDAGISSLRAEARSVAAGSGAASGPIEGFMAKISRNLGEILRAELEYIETLREPGIALGDHLLAVQTMQTCCSQAAAAIGEVIGIVQKATRSDRSHHDVSPAFLVADVLGLMGAPAMAAGFSLTMSHHGPFPKSIRCDPTLLRQVLLDLISQAIRHPRPGLIDVVLEVATPEDSRRGSELCIHVDVSGDQTLEPEGLHGGLDDTRRLVGVLGATLTSGAAAPGGTRFTLGIDLQERSGEMLQDLGGVQGRAASSPLRGRVLLAEDRAYHQRLTSFFLGRAGLEVEVADDGEVACQVAIAALVAGRPFDLILMDLDMPNMNGLEAARRIRAAGVTQPIIALSARVGDEERESSRAAGCDDFAAKPISCGGLIEMVDRHLGEPAHDPR